jgi:hypothetical protein
VPPGCSSPLFLNQALSPHQSVSAVMAWLLVALKKLLVKSWPNP